MPAVAILFIAGTLIWLGILFIGTQMISNKIPISMILFSISLFIWVAIAYNHIEYSVKETLPIIEIKNDRYSYQICILDNDEINLTKYFGRNTNAKTVTHLETENWVCGVYFKKDEKYVVDWPLEKKE